MAGSEPVTSPDQLKPRNLKPARIGAIVSAVLLLLMMFGNHRGRVENLWLMGLAALLIAIVIGDAVLRRNGLRS
ncbi:MAG TPA: DUF2631 domain-containing protein [Micromonospora sp.]